MFPFLLFEGLDNTGKSIIAKKIAKKINAALYYGVPELLLPFREKFDNLDDEISFAFYIIGNHIIDSQISESRKTRNVIVDRFFFSTIAYHSVKLGRNLDSFLNEMKNIPDKIYYLTGQIEEINKRTQKKGLKSNELYSPTFFKEFIRNYDRVLSRYSNIVIIDTTYNSIEEAYRIVLDDLLNSGIII